LQSISNKPKMFTAQAINEAGQIVGRRLVDPIGTQAYIWANGQVTDLGTLGGPQSDPAEINEFGVVVGNADTSQVRIAGHPELGYVTHAFIYENQTLEDLNSLIDPSLRLTLIDARGINNAGQIIARTSSQSVLLTPVPEPAGALWFAAASTVFLKRRRYTSHPLRYSFLTY